MSCNTSYQEVHSNAGTLNLK